MLRDAALGVDATPATRAVLNGADSGLAYPVALLVSASCSAAERIRFTVV